MNARAKRFPLLDSLRAIAATMILLGHVAAPSGARENADLAPYLDHLPVGVAVFFVISAFLLYRPFLRARIDGRRRLSVAAYGWRRVLRIVPAYWVALAVSAIVLGTAGVFGVRGIFTYFGFAQAYWNDTVLGGIAVAWSLCIEVAFYLFLPLYALLMARLPGRTRGQRIGTELIVLAAVALVSFLYKILVASTGLHDHNAFVLALPSYLDWFAAGMALAVVSVWLEGRDVAPAALRLVDRWPSLCWLAAAALYWVVSTRISATGTFPRPDEVGYIAEHMLYLLVAVALFLPAVFGDPARGAVRRLLANPVLLYLGAISYGIFLWHIPVIEQLKRWDLGSVDLGPSYLMWAVVTLALTTAIATVSWFAIERPALSLKRLVGPDREPQPEEATAEPAHSRPLALGNTR
jgi:peptidoglycan/LPS O-acetylase OafA/YrhL